MMHEGVEVTGVPAPVTGADCPRCRHGEKFHLWPAPTAIPCYPRSEGCGKTNADTMATVCRCLYFVEQQKGGSVEPEEVGKGSRQRRYSCQCSTHTINRVDKKGNVIGSYSAPGPFAFRGPANVDYSAFCQFCDAVFALEPEVPAKKRKSVLCGAHCPPGSHTHEGDA